MTSAQRGYLQLSSSLLNVKDFGIFYQWRYRDAQDISQFETEGPVGCLLISNLPICSQNVAGICTPTKKPLPKKSPSFVGTYIQIYTVHGAYGHYFNGILWVYKPTTTTGGPHHRWSILVDPIGSTWCQNSSNLNPSQTGVVKCPI